MESQIENITVVKKEDISVSTEDFIELLIELDALQRLYHAWSDEEMTDDEQFAKMDILEHMICKKSELRDHLLAELRTAYPELDQFAWATPQYDA